MKNIDILRLLYYDLTLIVSEVERVNSASNNLAKSWARGAMWIAGLAVVFWLGAALMHTPAVATQLASWKLVPTPERYTELAFDQHLALPSVVPTTKPVAFGFRVTNHEGGAKAYSYVVAWQAPGSSARTVATGSVTLADGASQSVSESFVLPKGVSMAEVTVTLPEQQESVHFWMGLAS